MRALVLGAVTALAMAGAALAEPTAQQLALSARYMEVVHLRENLDTTVTQMIPTMTAEMGRSINIPEEAKVTISTVTTQIMRELFPKMVDGMQAIVAETFTEDELNAAIAFYETPQGRSIIAKTPQINARFLPMMGPMMREAQEKMRARLMEICPGGKCPAAPKS